MIGATTERWTFTVEQQGRDWDGKLTWTRTAGIEVDEQTARDMYRKAIREGLPNHLRAPRLTRVTRTTVDEQPTVVNCPRGGQCPPDCPRTIHTGCRHLQEHR